MPVILEGKRASGGLVLCESRDGVRPLRLLINQTLRCKVPCLRDLIGSGTGSNLHKSVDNVDQNGLH